MESTLNCSLAELLGRHCLLSSFLLQTRAGTAPAALGAPLGFRPFLFCPHSVPSPVLIKKFSDTSKAFMNIMSAQASTGSTSALRWVLSCLATLLRKQDLEAWSYPVTLQVYHGLLSFTVHSKPKVRLLGPQNMGGGGGGHSGNCTGAGLSEWDWGGCPEDRFLAWMFSFLPLTPYLLSSRM